MHSEVGVYLQMEAWNEDDSHPNYVEHVNPSTFAFDFLFWISLILCAFYFVFDIIFHQSKHKAVVHLSSLSTWYSQADPGLQAPHHRCHLETPGGGPAPPSSCSKGSTVWCKSSVHADLHEQPCRAPGAAGEAGWGRAEVFGVRGDLSGRFTKGIFWFGQGLKPEDSFCFPVLLDDFWAN